MRTALAAILMTSLASATRSAEPDLTRPNIILMMADDMGMGDTSAYQDFTRNRDSDQVRTPNMDRLTRLGVRFTDAHTPSSRCTPTRYALLTGRYPWRNRLKHWVLFGVQGDPMIEADRPTIGTLCQSHGYRTGLVGKWHVGLRYRQSSGQPADGWDDADLSQPMFDTPLDHGFDFCRLTSRSHGTSGPSANARNPEKRNGPNQSSGPGHVHGRTVVGATGNGKQIVDSGPHAYVLSELGGRHLESAFDFLDQHGPGGSFAEQSFFLYYPSNSNHGPHTPDTAIRGRKVKGAATSVDGSPMNTRSDYIYENDVVLGHLIDFLQQTDDPRRPGQKLSDNTILIFTSDNGAEIKAKTATGPFRSNKGSVYEGGHRVPFLVSWPAGSVGDGNEATPGRTETALIGLQDMYATFSDILGTPLPNLDTGEKGGEDSTSVLAAWRGQRIENRAMFFNDHREAQDHAAVAIRLDDPVVNGETVSGQWKLFFDEQLLRAGIAQAIELFDLSTDRREATNLMSRSRHQPIVEYLTDVAVQHRTVGGHRLAGSNWNQRIALDWRESGNESPLVQRLDLRELLRQSEDPAINIDVTASDEEKLVVSIRAVDGDGEPANRFSVNPRGLGITGGAYDQVDSSEALLFQFNQDVLVESVSIVAGNGNCGGFYQVGEDSPMAVYCVDEDIDAQDQSGILSDIGIVRAGEVLRIDSSPHFGVEQPGQWRLANMMIRSRGKQ